MQKLISMLIVLLNVAALAACRDRDQTDLKTYYLLHPKELSHQVVFCREASMQARIKAQCQVVSEAAEEVMSLIDEHHRNPQAFGQRVLEAEMNYAKTGQNKVEVETLLAVVSLSGPE